MNVRPRDFKLEISRKLELISLELTLLEVVQSEPLTKLLYRVLVVIAVLCILYLIFG